MEVTPLKRWRRWEIFNIGLFEICVWLSCDLRRLQLLTVHHYQMMDLKMNLSLDSHDSEVANVGD
jgi:hypothetical protein